jgi:chorismate lyase/3-hydroxybenzoate synthase
MIPFMGRLVGAARARLEVEAAPDVPGWARALVDAKPSDGIDGLDGWGTGAVFGGDRAVLASVRVIGAAAMAPERFEDAVDRAIEGVIGAVAGTAAPYPVRMWNYLPGIHDAMGPGQDRYRRFNVARHRAMSRRFGARAVARGDLPAASCIGHVGTDAVIHVLGAVAPGEPVENPRQVPAFAYSRKYGERPPCFSRATVARLGGRRVILVAGTASVLGEDSAHEGRLMEQATETLANLSAVVGRAREKAGAPGGWDLRDLAEVRVYHKREADRARLVGRLASLGPIEWVRADICREELLVEIEAVAHVPEPHVNGR